MSGKTYLYAISSEEGWTKFGVSKDPEGRLRTLQTANPVPLHLMHTEAFSTPELARRAEKNVHRFLSASRGRGEWFSVNIELAQLVVAYTAKVPAKQFEKYLNSPEFSGGHLQ